MAISTAAQFLLRGEIFLALTVYSDGQPAIPDECITFKYQETLEVKF